MLICRDETVHLIGQCNIILPGPMSVLIKCKYEGRAKSSVTNRLP